MSESLTAPRSVLVRAVPTFSRAVAAVHGAVRRLVRRHPRWVAAFAAIVVGCGGLWVVDYFSMEKAALRRLAEVRGWTAGPTALGEAVRRWPKNLLTRSLARVPSKRIVTALILEGKRPTDDDLAMFVAAFPRIHTVDASSSSITDSSLEHFATLPMLSTLKLRHTAVTDAGLAHLGSWSMLSEIDLRGTRVTDDGLSELARLSQLANLYVSGAGITDTGLAHLRGSNLWRLEIANTSVTDEGVAELATMPRLNHLDVSGTGITDAGLAHLSGKPMRVINVTGTQVTDAGVAAFEAANPGCVVWR